MMNIKCGRYTYQLREGDYILDNGACLRFTPKDNSELPFGEWHRATSVKVSKKEFNRLVLSTNWQIKMNTDRILTYYIWKEGD